MCLWGSVRVCDAGVLRTVVVGSSTATTSDDGDNDGDDDVDGSNGFANVGPRGVHQSPVHIGVEVRHHGRVGADASDIAKQPGRTKAEAVVVGRMAQKNYTLVHVDDGAAIVQGAWQLPTVGHCLPDGDGERAPSALASWGLYPCIL